VPAATHRQASPAGQRSVCSSTVTGNECALSTVFSPRNANGSLRRARKQRPQAAPASSAPKQRLLSPPPQPSRIAVRSHIARRSQTRPSPSTAVLHLLSVRSLESQNDANFKRNPLGKAAIRGDQRWARFLSSVSSNDDSPKKDRFSGFHHPVNSSSHKFCPQTGPVPTLGELLYRNFPQFCTTESPRPNPPLN
jgi:hypothetical protein